MALSNATKITLSRTIGRAADAFETGQYAPYGFTPDAAANAITAALASINANSTDTPKGADLKAALLRVAALANAPHIQSHANEAATWASAAAALL
jgi:hypothetical protein